MKPFFEKRREQDVKLHFNDKGDLFFKPHFHSNLEILVVKKGNISITNNGEKYSVCDGQVFINDCYDIHGYGHNDNGEFRLVIIPVAYAKRFFNLVSDNTFTSPLITNSDLTDKLFEIVDRIFKVSQNENVIKAGVDLFLALIFENLELTKNKRRPQYTLIKNILDYLSRNFKNDVTLPVVAKEFGYTEAHVSRLFNKFFKCSIGVYVNNLRINYVLEKIASNEVNVTSAIFESGFKSVQTYYRNLARYKKDI